MITADWQIIIWAIMLLPLCGSLLAGLAGKQLGRTGAHTVTIAGVAMACLLSCYVAYNILFTGIPAFNFNAYTWAVSGSFQFSIGFLIDHLTVFMLVVVTFVSLLVHIYSIGYMQDDPGYQRFFCYMSLFTFAMLMLVAANNFVQLYFGWEGVGLVSYLLIGFWFKRESAVFGSLKAFLVNRVGDFGFLLGMAIIFNYLNTLDYNAVFSMAPNLANQTIDITAHHQWSALTVACILLFIGAMGKSAQMPLHVWLPESMEGPTPISALIHAATMVTAGVYMVSRMSPIFEYSAVALSVVLIVGATTALFTGIIAIVQTDIKRVVAYSTLSQLGYMVAALGVSAYAAGMFHLITHAFFKALLFLAAGSVIVALHHEQDMRKMGNLYRYLPITYITFLIGALALSAIPPFAGFYSKDSIIEAIHLSPLIGAHFAYYCVLIGSFVTAFYIFRAFFLVFHSEERLDPQIKAHLKEPAAVVWVPLVILAIPSVLIGGPLISGLLYQPNGLLGNSLLVLPQYNVLAIMAQHYQGAWAMIGSAFLQLPVWLALAGIVVAWLCYVRFPHAPAYFAHRFAWLYKLLIHKYGFDDFNQLVLVKTTVGMAGFCFKSCDERFLDQQLVNGSGRAINWLSASLRKVQSGYLYHYAFAMILGVLVLLAWILFF